MGIILFFAWLFGREDEELEKEENDILEANEFVADRFADADEMNIMRVKHDIDSRAHTDVEDLEEMEEENQFIRFGWWRRN